MDFDEDNRYLNWSKNTMSFLEFIQYDTWTVSVDINVLHEFDVNAMKRTEREWNQDTQPQTGSTYIEHEARKAGIYLPSDVIQLCVKMIGLNSVVWHIDDPKVINRILCAECGDEFESDNVFQIGKLNWGIEVNPNGFGEEGEGFCGVFVRLLGMPSSWKSILCQFHIECRQMQHKMVFSQAYSEPNSYGFYISSFEDLKASCICGNELTFVITMHITRITLKERCRILYQMTTNKYKTNTQLQWEIDEEVMQKLKSFDKGNGICSDILNDIWFLRLYPKGAWDTKEG
eukprot:270780_1